MIGRVAQLHPYQRVSESHLVANIQLLAPEVYDAGVTYVPRRGAVIRYAVPCFVMGPWRAAVHRRVKEAVERVRPAHLTCTVECTNTWLHDALIITWAVAAVVFLAWIVS